ncbi:hypothetical protein L873DRAFT_1661947, partial [Choiromyces venosus 120613-1]
VIREPCEKYDQDYLDKIWKLGRDRVMVWEVFYGNLRLKLVVVLGKVKVDSCKYTKYILDPVLIPFWHDYCERFG